jgi:general stress protein 26
MQRVTTFAEIEHEFLHRIQTMVYCNLATVDDHRRPHSRVIHPIWEGPIGWLTTGPRTAKARQINANPYVSLAYIANPFQPLYVECLATWQDDPATRQHVWHLYKTIPEPLGSDLKLTWGEVDNPAYAVLRLTPWRIELYDLPNQQNRKVWYAADHTP